MRRKLSIYIAALGDSAEDILLNFYNGKNFKELHSHITLLSEQIILIGEMHLAYPVLHYFHNSNPKKDLSVTLINLDEAITIMISYIPEDLWPAKNQLHFLRKAISTYLETLNEAFIHQSETAPPIPNVEKLKDAGIPLLSDNNQIEKNYESVKERRKLLNGLLKVGNWNWQSITKSKFTPKINITGKEEE